MELDAAEMLKRGLSRETQIRRDARGNWFSEGDEITHANVTRAFDAWVEVAADGRYCLKNDINWAYITLEGAPYFVRRVALFDNGVKLFLSNEREAWLDPATLRLDADGVLYASVFEKGLAARFDRHAMASLAPIVDEDERGVLLRIGAQVFRPTIVQDPLRFAANSE